jgi:hypothetical protein
MASASVRFPDLTPPVQWSSFSLPPQIRLIPPGKTRETAQATIVVSPIVPRLPQLPPPERLILQALDAEAKLRLEVHARGEPEKAPSDSGLEGIAVHVEATERDGSGSQRRIYVIYQDEAFMYGINYMAFGQAYDEHLEAFWKTARSIRPFQGRVVPPSPPPDPVID